MRFLSKLRPSCRFNCMTTMVVAFLHGMCRKEVGREWCETRCILAESFNSILFFEPYANIIFLLATLELTDLINNCTIKMKSAILASLIASAAAFAPAQQAQTSTALNVNELEIGITAPLGVYDPLGWLESQPESFERRRAVERKHGRVAMAAVVGVIVHNNHIVFDGYLSTSQNLKFSDLPTGVDGIRAIPNAGLLQILAFFALVELAWMPASQYDGDYGVGWFGENLNPEEKSRKLNAEINNGRAAMMGIMGNMVVEVMTGQTMYEQYSAGHISPFGDGAGAF